MIASKTPELPWIKLASDIFHWEGEDYLLTVDYFSKYIDVDRLLTSKELIEVLNLKYVDMAYQRYFELITGHKFCHPNVRHS